MERSHGARFWFLWDFLDGTATRVMGGAIPRSGPDLIPVPTIPLRTRPQLGHSLVFIADCEWRLASTQPHARPSARSMRDNDDSSRRLCVLIHYHLVANPISTIAMASLPPSVVSTDERNALGPVGASLFPIGCECRFTTSRCPSQIDPCCGTLPR